MFAWSWAYRAFSRLHRRELRNMEPIRDFAELVLETAISEGDTSGECGAMRNGLENGSGLLENATTTESEHPGNGGSERVIGDQVVQERVGNGVGVASGNGTVARKEWSSGVGRRRRTALSNMAERESHRKYPNAMLDETITLLFAGQDTSAATLSWTLHLLSLPENKDYVLQV
ncbi:unnamed protein product, partial [Sphacelaria rigidula]